MKVNSSALYLFIYLFSLSKWNLVESAETGDANFPLMADAAPEAILADPNADLVAQLNDLKAENDLMAQIADLKAENEKLKAELAAGAPAARVAGARGGIVAGRAGARGAVPRRGVVGRGPVATRAPECGINNISSSGKVISTVAHNATAYVVDGSQHTLAFNQGTAQSNNTFNATQRNSDLILTGTRPRVTIPAAENAAAERLNAHAAEANAAAAKKEGAAKVPKKHRDPNEVGIVNIESDDKVIATVASDSTVYTVDGDKHTLSLNQDTSLSDNTFEKGSFPLGAAGAAAHVAAAPKHLREVAAELDGEPLTVVDEGGESVFTESPVFPA